MKRFCFFIFILALSFSYLFASGKRDNSEISVKNSQSWNEKIDISSKKKGKYNILITAEDIAGNEGYAGPFNMFIEPKSDLPIVRINNPVEDVRVLGNINVVGTCFDDDGVAYVELRIDGEESTYKAKGKEFWSYFINTSKMEEGVHKIEAWGVDIHGVKGETYTTTFNLDRRKPETVVKNRNVGDLVSGKISLEGSVEDGNGVERLTYSLDNGQTFEDARISYSKSEQAWRFKITVDTRKMEDGPKVCWFKSYDKLGSVGIFTFLFFVDNTPPLVEFLYPAAGAEAGGSVFTVAGKAFDDANLKSLSWICGREKGEFEIIPGNPYWIKEFDLSKTGGSSASVTIIATDNSGNVVKASKTVKIDRNKDKPVVMLVSPVQDEIAEDKLFVAGAVRGKYGVSEIHYKVDNGSERSVKPENGAFGFYLDSVPAGRHNLTVYAVNEKGIKGDSVTVQFTGGGSAPSVAFDSNETVIPSFNVNGRASAYIVIKAPSGLKSLSYSENGSEASAVAIKQGATEHRIRLPINVKSSLGIMEFDVTAVDLKDRSITQKLAARLVGPDGAGGEESFVWAGGKKDGSGRILLLDGAELAAVYQPKEGADIASVRLVNGHGLTLENSGGILKIKAERDGVYSGIRVEVTDNNGGVYTSPAINILSGANINLSIPDKPVFVKNSFVLSGSVVSDSSIRKVEYILGTGEPQRLSSTFEKRIDLNAFEDGAVLLTVRAEDAGGNEIKTHRILHKAASLPVATMILPKEGDTINGSVTAAFEVLSYMPIIRAEYDSAAKGSSSWKQMDVTTVPSMIIGSASEPISKNMRFRFTDIAENTKIVDGFNFKIDNSEDAPVVEIHLPEENEVINKDFVISGIIYDDDAPAKIYYRIDDGAYTSIEVKNSFAIPVSLSSLTDNEHTISMYGEDIYGVRGKTVTKKIRVSLNLPKTVITSPSINDTLKGLIVIKGTAEDKNGIEHVEISMDNGNTFNKAEGKENWSYTVNTHIIDDGTHVVFVKVFDKYGESDILSTLLNIDNTSPIMKFEYPLPGSKLDKTLFVSGQTRDNISLEGVTMRIKSLDGNSVPSSLAEIKLKTELVVAEQIDISRLQEGKYNLEIRGFDKADNISEISRNFDVYRRRDKDRVEILYPLNGERVKGEFNVYGRIVSDEKVSEASLYIDGKLIETAPVSKTLYTAFKISPEKISAGEHSISIRAASDKKNLSSNTHSISYSPQGAWVTIDNFAMGDFAVERPYLRGRAGYSVSEEEKEHIFSKQANSEERRSFKEKKVKKVEVSLDNGKTFKPAKMYKGWKFRIETENMSEGNHFLLVRATMANKEIAISRTLIKIDKTSPSVSLITPSEGGRYNNEIEFIGLASDDIELSDVKIALRKGDKATYGVPKFIQGLHFEMGFWGASLWNMGIGLSFFDDNVKLQFHYGQFTQKQRNLVLKERANLVRYGGHIFSLKLLANIFQLPFGYYFGPDWAWLHMTGALGAQFSLFTDTQSGRPQVLSALLTQLEFPRVKLPKRKHFSSFSFFTEGQLWFIPTDVDSSSKKSAIKSVVPHISCGIRVDVF